MSITFSRNTTWFSAILNIAGVYHILWGISVVFFPCFWFDLGSLSYPNYMQLWQFIGLYEIVFGIGFLMAAASPLRHWRIVLLGFISKLSVTIGFIYFYLKGGEPTAIFHMVLSNHIFWLIPFFIILYNAYRHQYLLDNEIIRLNNVHASELLSFYETNHGENLKDLSEKQPILIVFLRNFGCSFCKETLLYIQQLRADIENKGTKLVLIHMQNEEKATADLKKYKLSDIDRISDPESMLYKGFKLKRGTLAQVLGWKVLLRAVYLFFTKGIYLSSPDGADVFQMPGVFLVHNGKVVKKFIHHSSADIPPYLDLATV
ncbi:MAG: hypothetical protein RJA25_129 [Bacteroidota bacterium]|jgi:peroxiredoxin